MKKETLEILPYIAIEELIKLRTLVNRFASDNVKLTTLRTFDNDQVLYEFTEVVSYYVFVIKDFNYDPINMKCSYIIYKRPESINNMSAIIHSVSFENISDLFQTWIADCIKMNEIKYKFLNHNSKFYENEFADFFSNNDPDASINPFEIDRQEIIFHFLAYAEKKVSESNKINEEIKLKLLEELSVLKEDVPNATKKIIVYRMSKLAEKIKKVSNKLFHDIFDVLKKELIKKVLFEGADQIPNTVKKIEHWISLLTQP